MSENIVYWYCGYCDHDMVTDLEEQERHIVECHAMKIEEQKKDVVDESQDLPELDMVDMVSFIVGRLHSEGIAATEEDVLKILDYEYEYMVMKGLASYEEGE